MGTTLGSHDSSAVKECACNAGEPSSIPGSGRSAERGHGNPLQYSSLENPHGQTMLAGCGPRGHKELDTTRLSTGQRSVDHPGSCGHLSSQDSGNDSRNLPINCGKFCGSSHGNSSRKNLGIWRFILYLLSWWGRVVRSSPTDQSFRGGKAGLGEETTKPGANGPSRKRKE